MSSTISTHAVKQMEEIYLCPISLQLMAEPFTMRCGHTFDKKNIHQHVVVNKKDICPLCRQNIRFNQGMPNILAKETIVNLKKQLLAKQMKHKMAVFVRYDGLKVRYVEKNGTLKELMHELCLLTETDKLEKLFQLFTITCNGKLLNYLYSKEPTLMLNQFMNNNSTVNLERRVKIQVK